MISSDREILLEIQGQVMKFNNEFKEFKAETNHRFDMIQLEQEYINTRIADLKDYLFGGVAVMAVIITFVGVFVPLWLSRKDKKTESIPAPETRHQEPRYSVNDFREIVENFQLKN